MNKQERIIVVLIGLLATTIALLVFSKFTPSPKENPVVIERVRCESGDYRDARRRRAWDIREVVQVEHEKSYAETMPDLSAESTYPYGYDPAWLTEERWSNFTDEYPNVDEIVSVVVSRTLDTNVFVVFLVDVDGETTALWTNGVEEEELIPVLSISPSLRSYPPSLYGPGVDQ